MKILWVGNVSMRFWKSQVIQKSRRRVTWQELQKWIVPSSSIYMTNCSIVPLLCFIYNTVYFWQVQYSQSICSVLKSNLFSWSLKYQFWVWPSFLVWSLPLNQFCVPPFLTAFISHLDDVGTRLERGHITYTIWEQKLLSTSSFIAPFDTFQMEKESKTWPLFFFYKRSWKVRNLKMWDMKYITS